MKLEGKNVGFAITGSFCTFAQIKEEIKKLVEEKANVIPIFSYNAQSTDTRFCNAKEYVKEIEEITGNKAILTIADAEPIGPKNLTDIMIIAPCTGNTLAKLYHGITDTPVLMAAKSHSRNKKPLVISVSTNDALGMNFKNIGGLMAVKEIYFVPFGEDNPKGKPKSMIAYVKDIIPTLEMALDGVQIQPIVK
ncbi:MAG: dipicolinate synthase subunit B [Lachnospira sp.]|nr:dipicolinate synthase subunit B [Lachnospira sp.]